MAFSSDQISSGPSSCSTPESSAHSNFIKQIVENDLASGKIKRLQTRFPPEPNGYLHIGHAKSICLNFGLAKEFCGCCNLRFDDTNPGTEESVYVESIAQDVKWLGYEWHKLAHASDYFERLYEYARELIHHGKAYVCSLSPEEIRAYRGDLTSPGRNSPYRDRSVEENLDLLERMRAGEFDEGEHVLRAKIDMAAPNILMRDPILYRIRKIPHYRTGQKWFIYPMYDFAHSLSDAIEGVTHSLCTLEFENNRPLYEWIISNVKAPSTPRQIEFARLNLTYTVLSKRRLIKLVESGQVNGWDDPRLPTISGLRRRGYTPASIRNFCERIGLAKAENLVEAAMLEHAVREDLNIHAPRVMAVLKPLRLIVENYPEGQTEEISFPYHPENPDLGSRTLHFARELVIERDDFMEDPPAKFYRLAPGREVRLRYAYYLTCTGFDKDPHSGEITTVRCRYDPATKGGDSPDGRKVKATLHWLSRAQAIPAEVRLYNPLFTIENPSLKSSEEFMEYINPESLVTLSDALVEPGLASSLAGSKFQFERQGYFCVDPDSTAERPVFNRTATLRDPWVNQQKRKPANAAK